METKTKHTPTPWNAYKPTGSRWHIGSSDSSHLIIGKINDDNSHTLAKANAEFIVRACNNFDALVEALKRISKGEGACSRDHLTHASNCIEEMKGIAKKAIQEAEA